MVSAARRPPATQRPAAMSTAMRKPWAKCWGSRAVGPVNPATSGSTATARSPAARATTLFTAEADAGALGRRSAHGRRGERGDRDGQADAKDDDRREHHRDVAARIGGPGEQQQTRRRRRSVRSSSAGVDRYVRQRRPERAENTSMMAVTGSRAKSRGEGAVVAATSWSSTGKRNKVPPSAP